MMMMSEDPQMPRREFVAGAARLRSRLGLTSELGELGRPLGRHAYNSDRISSSAPP